MMLYKDKVYVIAVSGGCDSMAVLDMLYQKDLKLIAAHVNYHVRPSADRDQKNVEEYCEEHNIPLSVLMAPERKNGNFEEWARTIRYQYFKEVADRHKAEGVIVAHHTDDALETYLLQKQSHRVPLYYGLNSISYVEGIKVFRPYLNKTKEELQNYCTEHKIPFGFDETNLDTTYKRNEIRAQLETYSTEEKAELYQKMLEENKKLQDFYGEVRFHKEECFEPFIKEKYRVLDKELRLEVLRQYLLEKGIDSRHFTIAHLAEIDHILFTEKNYYKEYGEMVFSYCYGAVRIERKPEEFSVVLNHIEYKDYGYFQITDQGNDLYGVTVNEDDFPLTIRNVRKNDEILLRFGTKKINRWFIDRKVDYIERRKWPVLVNRQNEVILFPGIGCNLHHYSNKHNMFMLK